MGGLGDQGVVDSPSAPLLGVLWWWRWGGDYAPWWQLPASLPSHLVAPLPGVEGTLLPIGSSSPSVRLSVGGRQLRRSAEFPAFESALLRSGR